jgi:uncharacterized damage-inducible protein DinB
MVADHLTRSACAHLHEGVRRIATCVEMLEPGDLWRDPNAQLASVGNLILHLRGNVSQYLLRGLGGQAYVRARDDEFASKPGTGAGELLAGLEATIGKACAVLGSLSGADLERDYEVQGFHLTGVDVVVHVVEHFSYHVGQITFATKLITNRATDYYAGRDLNRQ